LKLSSMRQGYASLASNAQCREQACAFVTLKRDGQWYSTTILAGEERDLQAMAEQIRSEDATFVIVYPPGDRLKPPYIER
jgi:hypothetical protein